MVDDGQHREWISLKNKTIDYDGRACIHGEISSIISVCSSLMYDRLILTNSRKT